MHQKVEFKDSRRKIARGVTETKGMTEPRLVDNCLVYDSSLSTRTATPQIYE